MKSLLVHVDGTARCAARLKLAGELAARHDLRLSALYATASPLFDGGWGYAADAVPFDALHELQVGWRSRALAAWQAEAAAGSGGGEWAEIGSGPALPAFVRHALYADLLVLGQADPADLEHQVPADFVASVLVGSGRPAVVVPYAGTHASVGARVLVAWKPAAESARALAAALAAAARRPRRSTSSSGAPRPPTTRRPASPATAGCTACRRACTATRRSPAMSASCCCRRLPTCRPTCW